MWVRSKRNGLLSAPSCLSKRFSNPAARGRPRFTFDGAHFGVAKKLGTDSRPCLWAAVFMSWRNGLILVRTTGTKRPVLLSQSLIFHVLLLSETQGSWLATSTSS